MKSTLYKLTQATGFLVLCTFFAFCGYLYGSRQLKYEQTRVILPEEYQWRLVINGFDIGPHGIDADIGPDTKAASDEARETMPDPYEFWAKMTYFGSAWK